MTYKFKKKLTNDFNRLKKVFLRNGIPDRVPFLEYYIDNEVVAGFLQEKPLDKNDKEQAPKYWEQRIRFYKEIGMDFVFVSMSIPLPKHNISTTEPNNTSEKRSWVSENKGPITTEEEFEKYPWPDKEL